MEDLESQSQAIDLATKIKSIYDNLDTYTSKRGSEEEAIDIINSDILFSDDSNFAKGENNSFELTLEKIVSKEGQLEGKFNLGLHKDIHPYIVELKNEYMDFLEIDYQVKLNVQDIESLVKQVVNMIEGFTMFTTENYKIDLGEESLVTMTGWEDIYLNNEKKKQYIKGALLRFEDDSDFITRVSKQEEDMYVLHGKDGTEARLSIRSTRLVLESDFVNTTKLALYRQSLDEYLLEDYKTMFGLVEKEIAETVTESRHMVKKDLFHVLATTKITKLFDKDSWYRENLNMRSKRMKKEGEIRNKKQKEESFVTNEDMRGNPIVSEEKKKEISETLLAKKVRAESSTGSEYIDNLAKNRKNLDSKVKDKQLLAIINTCLNHIEKKIYTIERYKIKNGLHIKSKSKLEELNNIIKSLLEVDLIAIYKHYKKYLGNKDVNIVYMKNKIREKLDIQGLGFSHYFNCGDIVSPYSNHDDEAYHDIGYSEDGLNIFATVHQKSRMFYNIQSNTIDLKIVRETPIRRYSRNGDYIILSEGKDSNAEGRRYPFTVYHIDSKRIMMEKILRIREEGEFTRRCQYDVVDDYFIAIGDEKLRVVEIGKEERNDFNISVDSENYTIATESKKLFTYSSRKLVIYNLSDKKFKKTFEFSKLFGDKVKVQYMHARDGQVKIIYKQDGKLQYSCYKEDDLLEDFDSAVAIVQQDISSLNNIDLIYNIKKAELFFSEDNKYAIFVKDNTIYTLNFTEYVVKLFVTETMGFNHVFLVRYSPNGSEAILRDGTSVYKLDLDLINELQTDEEVEEEFKLLDGRRKLVDQFQFIHNKKFLEEQEEDRKLLDGKQSLLNVLQNHHNKLETSEVDSEFQDSLKEDIESRDEDAELVLENDEDEKKELDITNEYDEIATLEEDSSKEQEIIDGRPKSHPSE